VFSAAANEVLEPGNAQNAPRWWRYLGPRTRTVADPNQHVGGEQQSRPVSPRCGSPAARPRCCCQGDLPGAGSSREARTGRRGARV